MDLENSLLHLVSYLKNVKYPMIVKQEIWWLEELFFKPGKPRKDLLIWVIEQLSRSSAALSESISCSADTTPANADSTSSSSTSNVPENDEALLAFCVKTGICRKNDKALIEGTASFEKQNKFWMLLLQSLRTHLGNPLQSGLPYKYFTDITSSSNFLELFKLKSDLIPPAVKIELKHKGNLKNIDELKDDLFREAANVPSELNINPNAVEQSYPYTEDFYERLNNLQANVKVSADNFLQNYEADLRTREPAISLPRESEQLGQNCEILREQLSQFTKQVECLRQLQTNKAHVMSQKTNYEEQLSESKVTKYEQLGELCKVWTK